MQNVVVNNFHNYRLRNNRSVGNGKSDNKKKNVRSARRPVSGSNN